MTPTLEQRKAAINKLKYKSLITTEDENFDYIAFPKGGRDVFIEALYELLTPSPQAPESEVEEAINAVKLAIEGFDDDIDIHGIATRHFKTLIRVALSKSAQEDEDGMPCVCCGKPSQVATPDDADMCHECFGQFNATEYDILKAQADGLVKAANAVIDGIDKNHEYQNQGDNPYSVMAGNSIRYEVPWDKMTELCKALQQFSATEI